MNKILVVDDELSIRESFSLILEGKYRVLTAASGEGALKYLTDQKIDLVYLDIRMPGLDGLETLRRMKEIDPEVEIVMVTAVNEVQKASEAIKYGAKDYIVKPFDVEAILKMTERILRRKLLTLEGEAIQKGAPKLFGLDAVMETIKKVAPKSTRVLILGEAGTEKETVAELIHAQSPRAELPLRLFSLSEKMSAAEIKVKLFGSAKGATTADLKKKAGLLDEVCGGTLFIDHVEYLPPETFSTEVRLIAGSSQPDLFDYFSETLIILPPLRERISSLPLLINHFLETFNEEYSKEVKEVAPEIEEILSNYSWPGNTEELKSLLERLVITAATDRITAADLPFDFLLKSGGAWGSDYSSLFEKEYVRKIYGECGQDLDQTAAVLGIKSTLLEGKI